MRILALGPQNVFPPVDGGKESIFGALSVLATHAEVTYVYPDVRDETIISCYREVGIRAVPVDYSPRDTMLRVVTATIRGKPFKFEKYSNAEFAQAIDREIGAIRFEAIVSFHAHTFHLAEILRRMRGWSVPILLREHNIEYELVASYRRSLIYPLKPIAYLFEWLTRREERRAWTTADAAAFITDHDLDIARGTGVAGNFFLAPEGTPLPDISSPYPVEPRLLVPLNPRARQSVANVRQFLRECWLPAVSRSRMSGVSLAVTGLDGMGIESLLGLPQGEQESARVKALGFVPNLSSTLRSSLAIVSPTYIGGGIRKKILEAMAHGVPVLATTLDVESCSCFVDGENIIEFDDSNGFARSVERLMSDPDYRGRIAVCGRSMVEEKASWKQFGEVVMKELCKLTVSGRRCLSSDPIR